MLTFFMERRFSRREVLRLGAGTLLSMGMWPGRLDAEDAPAAGSFLFVVINDLHFREKECAPWFEAAARAIKTSANAAELCLIAGDLSDDGTASQLTGIRDAFEALRVPVHSVIGNHDYRSNSDRRAFEQVINARTNYSFRHRGWQFVGLDTTEGTKWREVTIPAQTFGWIDEQLPGFDRRLPTILFTHFPLGSGVSMRPRNADSLLERFLGFNLRAVFCGHFHGFTERISGPAPIVTNRCCARVRGNMDGSREKGWFVCEAGSSGTVTRRFVEFVPPAEV